MEWNRQIETFATENYSQALDFLINLAKIPAPSHHEERRVAYISKWLGAIGCAHFYVDAAQNVIIPIGCTDDKPLVVFMAHTDVVFPDTEELKIVYENGRVQGPGAGDDTGNVAVLMMAAKYILENRLLPKAYGILLVANSCEEGLGNLKGSREIVKNFGGRIDQFYTFDGSTGKVLSRSVGSMRYKVRITTEGGHSYREFGNRSAIAYTAAMIQELYQIKAPDFGKTTYNVGTICGGTSVNTIAQSTEITFEVRSDYKEGLDLLLSHFEAVVACYRHKGIGVETEVIGERPCMGEVDPRRQEAIQQRAAEAVRRHYDIEPIFNSGSTDCNIPLAHGIPSTRVGTIICGGAHTREEWMEAQSLISGMKMALDLILGYFN